MVRRLFTVAAAASLLLCAGMIASWWHSHRVRLDVVALALGGHRCEITSADGALAVTYLSDWPGGAGCRMASVGVAGEGPPWPRLRRVQYGAAATRYGELPGGLWWTSGERSLDLNADGSPAQPTMFGAQTPTSLALLVPYRQIEGRHRQVATAAAIPPLFWLAGWAGGSLLGVRRRRAAGLCVLCGYDLRATPERCPECGAAAATGAGTLLPAPDPRSRTSK